MTGANEHPTCVGTRCVYAHVLPDGRVYVGQTANVEKRWREGRGYKHNKEFDAAITFFGWDAIEHLILADGLTSQEAAKAEHAMIRLLDATNPAYGFNHQNGGEVNNTGSHWSEEARAKASNAWKGKRRGTANGNHKAVVCETDCRYFATVKDAAAFYGLKQWMLSQVLIGKQKQSHGLRFRYAKEVMTDGVRAKEASGDSH